jgi:hypothetical protein
MGSFSPPVQISPILFVLVGHFGELTDSFCFT